MNCPINNAYCTPRACVHCGHIFCGHEPECKPVGFSHQFCSGECRDAKYTEIYALGKERFQQSRMVLIVEQEWCYLVLNRHKASKEHRGYGFKILQESASLRDGKLGLDYCHYPGFSTDDHPVSYKLYPRLAVAIAVYDEYDSSMWTIVGFRMLDGEIDTYGVGGHIEVIDRRGKE
jgi:hypothetical protein